MGWFYIGIAQIALDHPPLCQTVKFGKKKCPKPSWQPLTPPGKRGKKVPQPSWQAPPPPYWQCPYGVWKEHISKGGFPKASAYILVLVLSS